MTTQATIETGDSLNKLADIYEVAWRDLADLNGVTPFLPLPPGELLTIPTAEQALKLAVDLAGQAIKQIDWLY